MNKIDQDREVFKLFLVTRCIGFLKQEVPVTFGKHFNRP